MHIAFLALDFPDKNGVGGGIGSFVKTLGAELVKHGFKVSVVAAQYRKNSFVEDVDGMSVYRLKLTMLPIVGGFFNYNKINQAFTDIHSRKAIDIVETSESQLAFVKKIKDVKYCIRMHGGHHYFAVAENRGFEKRKVYQEKKSLAKADFQLAVSHYVAQKTKELLSLKTDAKVIYNPINTDAFKKADATKVVKNSLVFIGSLVEKKGIRQLVLAMPKIIKEVPDAILTVVGRDGYIPGTDKKYLPVLQKAIPKELKDKIIFTGPVPHSEIPNYLEHAEVCVYPSHMEAMPIAWLEALAMGKPFVGSKTGPGPEAVFEGKTGVLCDPHNPEDIAEKVIWLLQNKEAAQKMGLAARADVLERFNIKKLVQENIDFYKSCLNA